MILILKFGGTDELDWEICYEELAKLEKFGYDINDFRAC